MATPETLAARLRTARHLPSGWAALDELLGGGWPLGKLAEIRGRGCTSLALGAVRQAQLQAEAQAQVPPGRQAGSRRRAGLGKASPSLDLPVAWIDGSGSFCPATASVDPSRLTLIQAPAPVQGPSRRRRAPTGPALFAADILLRSRAYALLILDLPPRRMPPTSAWFRLARLAAHAQTALLLLHPADPVREWDPVWDRQSQRERGPDESRDDGSTGALSGSASALLVDVRLGRTQGPEWGEWAPPDLEVMLRRKRDGTGLHPSPTPLRLPALD